MQRLDLLVTLLDDPFALAADDLAKFRRACLNKSNTLPQVIGSFRHSDRASSVMMVSI